MVRVRWGACGAAGAAARTRRARVGGCRGGGLLGRRRAVQIDRGAGSCRRRRAAACQVGTCRPYGVRHSLQHPRAVHAAAGLPVRAGALSCCSRAAAAAAAAAGVCMWRVHPERGSRRCRAGGGTSGSVTGRSCNSWSVRSASCQGLVPPSIASGARC
ncbi:MAG: hypothetical protein J3K34DRAFT_448389, partial [Monoraphidium minutum]